MSKDVKHICAYFLYPTVNIANILNGTPLAVKVYEMFSISVMVNWIKQPMHGYGYDFMRIYRNHKPNQPY